MVAAAIREEAERHGYKGPATLDEWADFDRYDSRGPWATPERERLIERMEAEAEQYWSTRT